MGSPLKIALGADHGGFELKQQLIEHVRSLGHRVEDCGTHGTEPTDYPRIAHAVATLVASGACDFGIIVDGAGIGSAMAANKVSGVLAAACYTEALARNSREHNDANVLTLGAGHVDAETAKRIVDTFLSASCTAERHRARVRMIREIEKGGIETGRSDAAGLAPAEIERITDRVKQLLAAPAGGAPLPPVIPAEQLAQLIDHTMLRPDATSADIQKLCEEARQFGFFSVCVNPSYVAEAKTLLRGTPVKVCAVVGFPLGAQPPEIKALESRRAIREGAQEIDMVINIGALRGGDDALVWKDIRGVVEICKEGRAVSKVILETALLTDEEKVRGCEAAMKAGADFVKTSTGFSKAGATVEDVTLMSRTVAPRKLGVKAAGGIRTYADVVRMIQAGATRVGCSNSVKIMEEARALTARKE
ncbi:MAG TPA: deoxyribose-phosphate aldolase [Thermoanaerobaculaceae bacterium]|nr:deoxyribose-phosphate aldolase [Thermoanaerobaculaceae bacterium]